MITEYVKLVVMSGCLLTLLAACAGRPAIEPEESTGADLEDQSFDLLFATEFPVASAEEALRRASQAMQTGEIDKALFFYVRALQFEPENVDLLAYIGEIHLQRNNAAFAKRAFLTARNHDPTHARSLEGLGLIYMAEGELDRAFGELTLAVANDGNLWRAHNALGVHADRSGDHATAMQHYDMALSINPDAAHVLNNRGNSKFLSGDVRGAMFDLYEAAQNLGFPQAWTNLGKVYASLGWYEEALAAYNEVLTEAHAYNNAGFAAIENRDYAEAERYIQEAIRLSPTYFPAAEKNLARLRDLR